MRDGGAPAGFHGGRWRMGGGRWGVAVDSASAFILVVLMFLNTLKTLSYVLAFEFDNAFFFAFFNELIHLYVLEYSQALPVLGFESCDPYVRSFKPLSSLRS